VKRQWRLRADGGPGGAVWGLLGLGVEHFGLRLGLAAQLASRRPARFAALDRISLSIADGQSVGIIGRNGAGKSTLLRVLGRIIIPN